MLALVSLPLVFISDVQAIVPELEFKNITRELGPGFGDPYNKYAWSMHDFGGYMYVGTNNVHYDLQGIMADGILDDGIGGTNPFDIFRVLQPYSDTHGAEIWRYNYATEIWDQDFGNGADEFSTGFRKMEVYGDTLYAATVAPGRAGGAPAAELYSTIGDGEWEKVDMTGGPIAPSLRAMQTFDDGSGEKLYVGTETMGIPGFEAEVWSYDKDSGWSKVATAPEAIQELAVYNNQLYAGTLKSDAGSVFVINTASNTATNVGPVLEDNAVGVAKLYSFDDTLYMGSANFVDGFEFWSMTGDEWTNITTDGFGNENNTYTWSMADYNDMLYMASFTQPDWDLASADIDSDIASLLSMVTKPELWVLDGDEWVSTKLPGFIEGWGIWDYGIRNMEVGNDTLFLGTASNLFAPDGDEMIIMILQSLLDDPNICLTEWIELHSDLFNRLIGPGTEIWAAKDSSTNPVPEPATMLLFGTGIAALAGFNRKKKK